MTNTDKVFWIFLGFGSLYVVFMMQLCEGRGDLRAMKIRDDYMQ
jgi:hypothetical protein